MTTVIRVAVGGAAEVWRRINTHDGGGEAKEEGVRFQGGQFLYRAQERRGIQRRVPVMVVPRVDGSLARRRKGDIGLPRGMPLLVG